MRYWWVNQNQTYKHEVPGGYLWSPKTRADGARHQFYENMLLVEPGDVVFSFCDTHIQALGIVRGKAVSSPKPTAFGAAGAAWGNDGWLVEVEFTELTVQPRPKDSIELLRPLLPSKFSPLQGNGNGNQVVYLTALPDNLAHALGTLIGTEFQEVSARAHNDAVEAASADDEAVIRDRADIGETEKAQLVLARRGQGLFRTRVELVEPACRVTGIRIRRHQIASHIKPWRSSSDVERLDGENGLMLAPHVDHLFDRGFITFADTGELMLSPLLDPQVADAWSLTMRIAAKPLTHRQRGYMDFHRREVFRSAAG